VFVISMAKRPNFTEWESEIVVREVHERRRTIFDHFKSPAGLRGVVVRQMAWEQVRDLVNARVYNIMYV
jgi:hypothetical protein